MDSGTSLDDMVHIARCLKPSNPKEATALVFQGSLMRNPVFGKIVWREVDQKGGANTERTLMENELEDAVSSGLTPCLPMRYASVEIEFADFMQTEMFRTVEDTMKEGGYRGASDHTLHMMFMEDCLGTTLAKYLNTEGSTEDVHAIVFMLYHALSWLRHKGISHHDLHGNNIILRTIEPTCVTFGDCRFVTSTGVNLGSTCTDLP
jgi:serine/threonine protein kinase